LNRSGAEIFSALRVAATIRINFVHLATFAAKFFFACRKSLSRFEVPPIRVRFVQPTDENIAFGG
jgi:hypothetical protein